jgi:hypothetical protein
MRLYAKAITTFNTSNSFKLGNQWTIRSDEPNTLYFQLVDLDQDSLRYIAGIGGSNQPVEVKATFPSIDDDAEIIKTATVDANDASIWKIELADDEVPASGNVIFSVKEGTTTRRFSALAFIAVENTDNQGDC